MLNFKIGFQDVEKQKVLKFAKMYIRY